MFEYDFIQQQICVHNKINTKILSTIMIDVCMNAQTYDYADFEVNLVSPCFQVDKKKLNHIFSIPRENVF